MWCGCWVRPDLPSDVARVKQGLADLLVDEPEFVGAKDARVAAEEPRAVTRHDLRHPHLALSDLKSRWHRQQQQRRERENTAGVCASVGRTQIEATRPVACARDLRGGRKEWRKGARCSLGLFGRPFVFGEGKEAAEGGRERRGRKG